MRLGDLKIESRSFKNRESINIDLVAHSNVKIAIVDRLTQRGLKINSNYHSLKLSYCH